MFAAPSYADEQIFTTSKDIALKIVSKIQKSKKYRDYCGTQCNDTSYYFENEAKTVAIKKQSGDSYSVVLNGFDAQFSKIYVLYKNKWVNVGVLCGFKFEGYIPPDELPKNVQPGD
jgi:hypothetical protein